MVAEFAVKGHEVRVVPSRPVVVDVSLVGGLAHVCGIARLRERGRSVHMLGRKSGV